MPLNDEKRRWCGWTEEEERRCRCRMEVEVEGLVDGISRSGLARFQDLGKHPVTAVAGVALEIHSPFCGGACERGRAGGGPGSAHFKFETDHSGTSEGKARDLRATHFTRLS